MNREVDAVLGSIAGGDVPSVGMDGIVNGTVTANGETAPPPLSGNGRAAATGGLPSMSKAEEKQLIKEAVTSREIPQTLKRFGALKNYVAGGEQLRVRKRIDNGALATVGNYNLKDIEHVGDVELFVAKYLEPKLGGGEYQLYLIDGKGVEAYAGSVYLIGPHREPTGAQAEGGLAGILRDQMAFNMSLLSRPQADPFEQATKAVEFMDRLGGGNKGGGSDVMIAMMQMQQQSQQMQMQMQQASQQQMAALLAPKGDDRLVAMLERMDRRLEKLESAPALPPPPPPPPPEKVDMPALITAITGAAGVLIAAMKRDPDIRPAELVAMVTGAQTAAQADRIGAKDIIAMFQRDRERERPLPTLKEQIETMAEVRNALGQLAPQPQGPQGTTFWDALVSLFNNQDFAKGLGDRVRTVGTTPEQQRQQVALTENRPAQEQPQVVLPADFDEKCKAIEDAKGGDDGTRATAVFEALRSLQPIDQWKPFVQTLLEALAKDDKTKALTGLGQWLKLLEKNGKLSNAAAAAAFDTYEKHFGMIRAYALEKMPVLRAMAGQPVPAPQVAAPAPTVTPAPADAQGAPTPTVTPSEPATNGVASGPPPAVVDVDEAYRDPYGVQ